MASSNSDSKEDGLTAKMQSDEAKAAARRLFTANCNELWNTIDIDRDRLFFR